MITNPACSSPSECPAERLEVERRYPQIELGADTAGRILEFLPRAPRPLSLEFLAGGHINSNYKVGLDDGRCVVLRIFPQGEAVFRKETEILRALTGVLPVPHLHLALWDRATFGYPCAVLEWIDALTLGEALATFPDEAAKIGAEVAGILHRVGTCRLPLPRFPPFAKYVKECLFVKNGAQYLGAGMAAELWAFVQEQAALLDRMHGGDCLVHGDFQGDNVLLRRDERHWRVAAILDWEWAHSGCYLRDLGSLVRHSGQSQAAFQEGLEAGFSQNGAPLPEKWLMAARTWDIAAHCEKLAFPRHRGQVTIRSIWFIKECLTDYGGAS